MVGGNMAKRMMAALMCHEEAPIGHGFGHGHGADNDHRLAIFIDRGHRLLSQFRQKVGRDRAKRIVNGGKPKLAGRSVAAKQPDTEDSCQDQDYTTHSGPPAALSRFPKESKLMIDHVQRFLRVPRMNPIICARVPTVD
jgi:hypothetical protein